MATAHVAPFLRSTAAQLRQRADNAPITVVLGNEAADLDSTIASLLVAHLASLSAPDCDRIYVPALPIARADLALRTDVTAFLSTLLPDAANLLFFQDDLPTIFSPASERPESLHVFLTDFNALPPSLAHLHPFISAILDHHVDTRDYVHARPRTIAAVGSATTLVILHFADLIASLPAPHRAEIATLALGPIAVDTALFDVGMARATEADVIAADICLAWRDGRDADLPASSASIDATVVTDTARTAHLVAALGDLHERLHAAKLAISHLSTSDLLRKDYKEFQHPTLDNTVYGMASVTWDLRAWQKRDGVTAWREAVAQWARDRHLHSLFILTAFTDEGRFTRQLAVVAPEPGRAEAIVDAVRDNAPEVRLENSEEGTFWWVRNIKMARKVIQPVLRRVLARL
ncbi:hypothetical protein GGF31_007375 [Allomyces arbusculus]|nr:hypothetical protein GGF31_007375 [Allomyces arbusculus]